MPAAARADSSAGCWYCGRRREPGNRRTSATSSMSYAATTSRKSWIGRVECPTVHMVSIETPVSPTADTHLRAHHCIHAWFVGNTRMQMRTLCDLELRYTSLESIDFGAGGQIYGTMEDTVSGERLTGCSR